MPTKKIAPAKEQNRVTGLLGKDAIMQLPRLRVAIAAGALVKGSASTIDLLLVGNLSAAKVRSVVAVIERQEGRELTYSILSYDRVLLPAERARPLHHYHPDQQAYRIGRR